MRVRDQIHGDIELSDAEYKLITSRPFERLRYIKQLGFSEFEYPGATHTRYQHSIGVLKVVTDMYNAVCKNHPSFYRDGDLELLRMMALCHDLGHAPYSHASENLSTISHEDRLTDILKYMSRDIILAHEYDIEPWDLIDQVYNGRGLTYASDKHLITLHSFMDGYIDADKIDYLERDAHNCGVAYGKFDRNALINNLTIAVDSSGIETIAIRMQGVQALESFILARYYMFTQIYMPPTERLLRYKFDKEMQTLLPNGEYPEDTVKFLKLDDNSFVKKLKCLRGIDYTLVFDSEYDADIKHRIDRKLGKYLLCDVPKKAIFRKNTDDQTVMVVDDVLNRVIPCAEASPILKNIEYTHIHKLRYYAESSKAASLKEEILKILSQKEKG